jgi:glycosyltransferase involved in cell wall biosynthesis
MLLLASDAVIPTIMRILIACTHQNVVGGVETYLRDVIAALRGRGHVVGLLASTEAVPSAAPIHETAADLPVWTLAGKDRAEIHRELEVWAPDVAFLHGLDAPANEEALVERFPTVLFAHGHNSTCVSGSRTHAFPIYQPCQKRFGLGCLFHYLPRRCGGLNPFTMNQLYRVAKRRFDLLPRYAAVIVTSRFMVEEYLRHGVSRPRLHRVPLFPTGLRPDPSAPEDRATSDRVLMVGRLYKEKGACLLVKALARVNDLLGRPVTLVVAGDGPERTRMEALSIRLNVRTEFHGWVGLEQRTVLMREADVLAVPSVCPETFGLVGVEAGCVGLPAVGFAVGGIPDWLIPGTSGELAPGDPPTAQGLAAAIRRVLADRDYLRRLSVGAWETAHNFSRDQHVASVEAVLAHVAGKPGSPHSLLEAANL